MTLKDLIPILQVAVGPVILVSGVGLLLLSLTNRFSRIIERTRQLTHVLHAPAPDRKDLVVAQLRVLLGQAQVVRASIGLAALSMLLTALLIIVLFISAVLQLDFAVAITVLFIACMACLIGSLVLFIVDINVSLRALHLEIGSFEGNQI